MVRRLLRFAVSGFCLLSLLACVGTGWLWWRSHRVLFTWFEAAGGGVWVSGESSEGHLGVSCNLRWPGEAYASAGSTYSWAGLDDDPRPVSDRVEGNEMRSWRRFGLAGEYGRDRIWLNGDGSVFFFPQRDGGRRSEPGGLSGPLPAWSLNNLPHWCVVSATAFPPLLWLGARTRRALVLRRRKRLGLCLNCGYDLRGSRESSRCSECGEAVAGKAGTPAAR